MNVGVSISRSHFQFFRIGGMAGSHGGPIFNCLRTLPPTSHRGCPVFHPRLVSILAASSCFAHQFGEPAFHLPVQLWLLLRLRALAPPACPAPVVRPPRTIPDGAGLGLRTCVPTDRTVSVSDSVSVIFHFLILESVATRFLFSSFFRGGRRNCQKESPGLVLLFFCS